MDTKLLWRAHIDEMEQKLTTTIAALSSLSSSAWGILIQELHAIYRGVAIPQIIYAYSAWSNANWSTNESASKRSASYKQSI
ncbi:hypothetical protein S40285_09638 [Stachybotrys chlorohalonatus IBT 40285]|uniref:Uncharacterized protein n=1 Tax=Stachybotrys chlorohalonatus (strain IBT 40285) TaxID=1283841 RepID=A0A084QZF8_STAC4|nr:hypothetical protein S40285_09638 [Stachybotrys chlorohalonata IBT 40285]